MQNALRVGPWLYYIILYLFIFSVKSSFLGWVSWLIMEFIWINYLYFSFYGLYILCSSELSFYCSMHSYVWSYFEKEGVKISLVSPWTLKMLQCRAYCQMRLILLNFLYVRIFSSLPSSFSPLLSPVSLCLPVSISFSLLRILKTGVKGCCIWNWYGDLYICNGYLWNGHASKTIVWWYRWLWPIRETHIF